MQLLTSINTAGEQQRYVCGIGPPTIRLATRVGARPTSRHLWLCVSKRNHTEIIVDHTCTRPRWVQGAENLRYRLDRVRHPGGAACFWTL